MYAQKLDAIGIIYKFGKSITYYIVLSLQRTLPDTNAGKRTVRVTEVSTVPASLNKGDVFILDAGFKIYIFNGPTSNLYEKAKGNC